MGILYLASKAVMQQHFIRELLAERITENKEGKSVYDMDYEELKSEIVLNAFRKKDIENDQNRWF